MLFSHILTFAFVFPSSFSVFSLFLHLCPPTILPEHRPEVLRDLFSKYGDVGDVYIPRDYQTRQPRGFAFVRFANRSEGEEAQKELDGTTLDGRVLAIHEAQQGRADNPKQAMIERGSGGRSGPPRDQRRWDNERDHRPRGGGDYGDYDYGNRGRDYHDNNRRRGGGDYGNDYDRGYGYGDRAGYRDNNNYSSSGSSRNTGYRHDNHRGYDGGRGRDYDYDYDRRGGPPAPAPAGYGGDRYRDRDRDMPLTRGGDRYREGTGAAAYDRGRNVNGGSPEVESRPLRSRTRSRSRDRAL